MLRWKLAGKCSQLIRHAHESSHISHALWRPISRMALTLSESALIPSFDTVWPTKVMNSFIKYVHVHVCITVFTRVRILIRNITLFFFLNYKLSHKTM